MSGGEEGRPGRRRGRRWGGGRGGGSAAIGTPPPRPLPAALAPRGRSGRLPPSQPLGDGAFPLPTPGWAGERAEEAARSPWHRSRDIRRSRDAAAPGSPTAAGVLRGLESHRLHLSPRPPLSHLQLSRSVRVQRGEFRAHRDPERRGGSCIPLLRWAGSKLQALPVPAATV